MDGMSAAKSVLFSKPRYLPVEKIFMTPEEGEATRLLHNEYSTLNITLISKPEQAADEIISALPHLPPHENLLQRLATVLGHEVLKHPDAQTTKLFTLHLQSISMDTENRVPTMGNNITRLVTLPVGQMQSSRGNVRMGDVETFDDVWDTTINQGLLLFTAYPNDIEESQLIDSRQERQILSEQQIKRLQLIQNRMLAEAQAASMQSLEAQTSLLGTLSHLRAMGARLGHYQQAAKNASVASATQITEFSQASQTIRSKSRALASSLKKDAMNGVLSPHLRETLRMGLKELRATGILAEKFVPKIVVIPRLKTFSAKTLVTRVSSLNIVPLTKASTQPRSRGVFVTLSPSRPFSNEKSALTGHEKSAAPKSGTQVKENFVKTAAIADKGAALTSQDKILSASALPAQKRSPAIEPKDNSATVNDRSTPPKGSNTDAKIAFTDHKLTPPAKERGEQAVLVATAVDGNVVRLEKITTATTSPISDDGSGTLSPAGIKAAESKVRSIPLVTSDTMVLATVQEKRAIAPTTQVMDGKVPAFLSLTVQDQAILNRDAPVVEAGISQVVIISKSKGSDPVLDIRKTEGHVVLSKTSEIVITPVAKIGYDQISPSLAQEDRKVTPNPSDHAVVRMPQISAPGSNAFTVATEETKVFESKPTNDSGRFETTIQSNPNNSEQLQPNHNALSMLTETISLEEKVGGLISNEITQEAVDQGHKTQQRMHDIQTVVLRDPILKEKDYPAPDSSLSVVLLPANDVLPARPEPTIKTVDPIEVTLRPTVLPQDKPLSDQASEPMPASELLPIHDIPGHEPGEQQTPVKSQAPTSPDKEYVVENASLPSQETDIVVHESALQVTLEFQQATKSLITKGPAEATQEEIITVTKQFKLEGKTCCAGGDCGGPGCPAMAMLSKMMAGIEPRL